MMSRNDKWGRQQLSRRQKQKLFPDLDGFAAAPEDIIIAKLIYFREGESEKHLRDITGILKLCPVELDTAYIEHWTTEMELKPIW